MQTILSRLQISNLLLSRNNNLVVKYSRTFQPSHDLLGEMNEFYVVYAIKFMLDD